ETNPTALRVEIGGKVIAYTGDTEWTDDVAAAARGADLLIAECYFYDKPVKWHLNYPAIAAKREACGARRMILTHMSREMLARAGGGPERGAPAALVLRVGAGAGVDPLAGVGEFCGGAASRRRRSRRSRAAPRRRRGLRAGARFQRGRVAAGGVGEGGRPA